MIFQQKEVYELMNLHKCCESANTPDQSTLKPKLNRQKAVQSNLRGKEVSVTQLKYHMLQKCIKNCFEGIPVFFFFFRNTA